MRGVRIAPFRTPRRTLWAGTLALASFDRSDAPGVYGGVLSERLELRVEDVSPGAALIGTLQDDVIYGRGGSDRIFGLAGRDYLDGGGGADWLFGGAGGDRLRGGGGSDHLDGGPGADVLLARDGKVDFIDCGRGRDTAYVDDRDRVRGCERVRRSK